MLQFCSRANWMCTNLSWPPGSPAFCMSEHSLVNSAMAFRLIVKSRMFFFGSWWLHWRLVCFSSSSIINILDRIPLYLTHPYPSFLCTFHSCSIWSQFRKQESNHSHDAMYIYTSYMDPNFTVYTFHQIPYSHIYIMLSYSRHLHLYNIHISILFPPPYTATPYAAPCPQPLGLQTCASTWLPEDQPHLHHCRSQLPTWS